MYMFTVVISFGVQIYFDDKHLVGPGKKCLGSGHGAGRF